MTFGNDGDELDGIFEVSGRTTANLDDFFFFLRLVSISAVI